MIDHIIQNTKPYEILIVDDTPESLGFLGHMLEEHGYRVRAASNGRHALKSVEARLPNLILLDVKMPEMDGYEVCRRLKANEPSRNVPVIFISAYTETTQKVEGFEAGGVDYITKPFEREEILARVECQRRLQRLTLYLEQEVNQRTEELRIANAQLQRELAERKQIEERLKASEERLRLTLEATQIGIFDWDVAHDKWFASPEYYTMLGYAPTKDPGDREQWLARTHPDDLAYVKAKIQEVLARKPSPDQSQVYEYDARLRHRDGSYRWEHVKGFGVKRDQQGRVTRILGIRMDITERKRIQDELVRHRDHLEELVRERTSELEASNKELEAFAYSVSHDLRAPLRHIDGFMELLQQNVMAVLDEKSRQYMGAISEAAQKMGLLIDDLLSFSRMGRHAMSFEQMDLGGLVREVISELEPDTAGRDIAWHIGDLPAVSADRTMIHMVLVNMVSNALKFTRPRAKAEIEIGSLSGEKSETVIFIRDNGVGFDMTYATRLFGVFQRLHRVDEFEGTGIGLANVRRIIARHGGRTWAEGKVDKGATFYFSLPQPLKEFFINKKPA